MRLLIFLGLLSPEYCQGQWQQQLRSPQGVLFDVLKDSFTGVSMRHATICNGRCNILDCMARCSSKENCNGLFITQGWRPLRVCALLSESNPDNIIPENGADTYTPTIMNRTKNVRAIQSKGPKIPTANWGIRTTEAPKQLKSKNICPDSDYSYAVANGTVCCSFGGRFRDESCNSFSYRESQCPTTNCYTRPEVITWRMEP